MGTRLYLFDDDRARAWLPFHLTRPTGELLFGCLGLRERAERVFRRPVAGHLAGEGLKGFEEEGTPPVVSPRDLSREEPRILLSSRAVVDWRAAPPGDEAATLTVGGQVVGWALPPGAPVPEEEALLDAETARGGGPALELPGTVLEWPWSLVEANAARISEDVAVLHRGSGLFGLTDVHLVGGERLVLGPDAHIEPGVVVDTRDGPVRLDAGAYVQAPARLAGPLHVGRGTVVLGGSIGRSSIGPTCKVRGEIDASVLLAYCNKAHDGYLGHALVGRWVNLGALTTNSDLKNNYGPVRVQLGDERLETGLLKVGCFLGDHVKTGIGTLLGTGAVVGAGSNVFGGGTPPSWIPPFSWVSGGEVVEFRLEPFLQTAEAAMGRRGVELSPGVRDLLARAWERTRGQRE